MQGKMRELQLQHARLAHVAENHHGAGDLPVLAVDRGHGVFDRRFEPVPTDEHGVHGKADDIVALSGQFHGIRSSSARVAVDDAEHFGKHPAERLCARPARHSFRDRIEIRDLAVHVGADDAVADGIEHDLRPFSFRKQRVVHRRAFEYVSQNQRK